MRPFYEHNGVTLYHGDAREILPALPAVDTIITDPVWPNAIAVLQGAEAPTELFASVARFFPEKCKRVIVQLGCDSDVRFLSGMPAALKYFRTCWLEYTCCGYKGRLLHTGDVAFAFGEPPAWRPGRMVIPGRCISTEADWKMPRHAAHKQAGRVPPESSHPCPRRIQHVEWLVKWFVDDAVLDPFAGSGTTLLAAKNLHMRAVGIEIEERFCEIAAKRLEQNTFDFAGGVA